MIAYVYYHVYKKNIQSLYEKNFVDKKSHKFFKKNLCDFIFTPLASLHHLIHLTSVSICIPVASNTNLEICSMNS